MLKSTESVLSNVCEISYYKGSHICTFTHTRGQPRTWTNADGSVHTEGMFVWVPLLSRTLDQPAVRSLPHLPHLVVLPTPAKHIRQLFGMQLGSKRKELSQLLRGNWRLPRGGEVFLTVSAGSALWTNLPFLCYHLCSCQRVLYNHVEDNRFQNCCDRRNA